MSRLLLLKIHQHCPAPRRQRSDNLWLPTYHLSIEAHVRCAGALRPLGARAPPEPGRANKHTCRALHSTTRTTGYRPRIRRGRLAWSRNSFARPSSYSSRTSHAPAVETGSLASHTTPPSTGTIFQPDPVVAPKCHGWFRVRLIGVISRKQALTQNCSSLQGFSRKKLKS